ncbi:uncharacterized protein LOC143453269 isoform X2 [Clavelina lepadiformis]|uniref:uncharacterized protein LOC143453269 isoform X2 n=1 Tax=Clavelina lepadiformis TaxID=159417 RepID=UPI0040428DDA
MLESSFVIFVLFCLASASSLNTTIATTPASTTCLTSGLTNLLAEAVFNTTDIASCAWSYGGVLDNKPFYSSGCENLTAGSDTIICNGAEGNDIKTSLNIGGPLVEGTLKLTISCNDTAGGSADNSSITRNVEPCSLNASTSPNAFASCAPSCEYNDTAMLSCSAGYDGQGVPVTCGSTCSFGEDIACKLNADVCGGGNYTGVNITSGIFAVDVTVSTNEIQRYNDENADVTCNAALADAIAWYYANNGSIVMFHNTSHPYQECLPTDDVNTTSVILHLGGNSTPSDASNTTYTCRARNDFNDLDETIDLVDIISVPVTITAQSNESLEVCYNHFTTLRCSYTSTPNPIKVTWSLTPIASNESTEVTEDSRVFIQTNNTLSSLTITNAVSNDNGVYTCDVTGARYDGSAPRKETQNFALTVQDDKPDDVTMESNGDHCTIKWKISSMSNVSGYQIAVKSKTLQILFNSSEAQRPEYRFFIEPEEEHYIATVAMLLNNDTCLGPVVAAAGNCTYQELKPQGSDPFRIATIVLGVLLGISLLVWLSYCVWNATRKKKPPRPVVKNAYEQNPHPTFSNVSQPENHHHHDNGSFEANPDDDENHYEHEIKPGRQNSNLHPHAGMTSVSHQHVRTYRLKTPETNNNADDIYDDIIASGNGGQATQSLSRDDRLRAPLPPTPGDEYEQPLQHLGGRFDNYDVTIENNEQRFAAQPGVQSSRHPR